jgi:hypothetical protein
LRFHGGGHGCLEIVIRADMHCAQYIVKG